ncbi:MAG: hypothetical protein KC618_05195, partial [Candidatus Omnitrophica bacterium]|nr:hypothetical protein [Candidatus Omnitrophota bacterium]
RVILLTIGFILTLSGAVRAQTFDPVVRDLAEQVIQGVYDDMKNVSQDYPELKGFNAAALSKGIDNVTKIEYEYINDKTLDKVYRFAVEVVPLDQVNTYGQGPKVFEIAYPVLNIKLIGLLDRKYASHFDAEPVIFKNAKKLLQYEQQQIPYALEVKSEKNVYNAGEPIEFTIILKNKTNQNLKLRELNEETLFFKFNGKEWGTRAMDPANVRHVLPVILGPQESITTTFYHEGVRRPQNVVIEGRYALPYNGSFAQDKISVEVK